MRSYADRDDDAQPLTIEAWLARQRADLAAVRAKAHAALDALLDAQQRLIEAEAQCIERDMHEITQH